MLILDRYIGQSVIINKNIRILIRKTKKNGVSLAFDAPPNVDIWREEIFEEIEKNKKESLR